MSGLKALETAAVGACPGEAIGKDVVLNKFA